MKKTILPGDTPAAWDAEALYNKALRYVERMNGNDSADWEYALWSSFALELLARAALANMNPALLADTDRSWASLYHALGFEPTEEKYTPKSIAVAEVFRRLNSIMPIFTKELESFCVLHTGRRNSELHSGELAFETLKSSSWQPRFYQTCQILLQSMGTSLEDFFGGDEAKVAEQLIAAALDDSAKAVRGDVEAHKRVWLGKSVEEQKTLAGQAALWSARHNGHRVDCPACGSPALVFGEPVSPTMQKLSDGDIIESQEHLPTQFQCIACGLKITGLSKLNIVGLGDRYKKTQTYDATQYYAPPEDDYQGYEEDNNEN